MSERVFVQINGTRQGTIVQSSNLENPVILFVHGGPGMPTFFVNTTHPTGSERHFTVVSWEQRGAGMSLPLKNHDALIHVIDSFCVVSEC